MNVEGTGNVLELCEGCSELERLNYVSTAYVAGERTGVVYEHELALGQGFKNHYESTKFQAEVWVREALDRVPTTIYRPAIVVGDSKTGETQKFDGPYYMLRTISVSMERGMPIPQFGALRRAVQRGAGGLRGGRAGRGLSASPRRSARPCTSWTRTRSARASCSTALSREYAGKEPAYTVPPSLVESSLRFKTVRDMFHGRAAGVDPLPQPRGPLRHPPRRRPARPRRPALPALRGVRGADGEVLPRARGRPGL